MPTAISLLPFNIVKLKLSQNYSLQDSKVLLSLSFKWKVLKITLNLKINLK